MSATEDPEGTATVIGVRWAGDAPDVRIRRDGLVASVLEPLVGLRLRYRATPDSPRHCLGHTPFRSSAAEHVDCPNPPLASGRKCDACMIIDATFASNLHHAHTRGRGELDPAVLEHLRQPNLLYLAAFRDGSVKVGTSTETRIQKRLTEQGAWKARIVARAEDGFAVRDVEDRVSADLSVPQSVAIGRKLDGMVAPRPDAALDDALAEHMTLVHHVLSVMDDARLSGMDEAWSFPEAHAAVWSGLHRYPLRLDSGAHDLEVIAACGRMVVVQRPCGTDRFVADLGQLYGVELDLGDHEPDALAVQDSLF